MGCPSSVHGRRQAGQLNKSKAASKVGSLPLLWPPATEIPFLLFALCCVFVVMIIFFTLSDDSQLFDLQSSRRGLLTSERLLFLCPLVCFHSCG